MRILFTFWLIVGFLTCITAQTLPIHLDDEVQPLRDQLDLELQEELDRLIASNTTLSLLAGQKKLAVGLVDLSDTSHVRFARINGNDMMYAASLPKIAVLLAIMDALEKKEIPESEKVQSDMRMMISKSNNAAATRLIDLIGFDKIEEVLTSPEYALYDEELGGGLWVGKRYAAAGNTNREPLKNLSHAATVTQVCRFYYLLAQGKLVSESRSKQMLEIMEGPEISHKFVRTLSKIAPKSRLFRKSGTWRTFHSDSVLVWGENRKYILVGLVDSAEGELLLRALAEQIDAQLISK